MQNNMEAGGKEKRENCTITGQNALKFHLLGYKHKKKSRVEVFENESQKGPPSKCTLYIPLKYMFVNIYTGLDRIIILFGHPDPHYST